MEKLLKLVRNLFFENEIIQVILSKSKNKDDNELSKVRICPFYKKDELLYQFEYFQGKKVLHENMSSEDAIECIFRLVDTQFENLAIFSKNADYQVLTNKKGNIKIIKSNATKRLESASHNRKKEYILEENNPVDFLVYLDIMNKQGRVHDKKRDKFKQINKFLEVIEDSINDFEKEDIINIVDFGCGKAYITFALYYYLVKVKGNKVNIVGLDIKEDVIEFCNKVALELGYVGLKFEIGEIKDFNELNNVDMIVTLHACDTATDDALVKAVGWGSKVILSVPCCQHELFSKINNELMSPMLKHGLIKERLSALITDSIRVKLLEALGYSVSVVEFIDIEHTPKNLMIKAIKKSNKNNQKSMDEYKKFVEFWGVKPYLEKQLITNENNKIQKRNEIL
ncbi:MAG TPA: SAM-dependent methyltransferase [Clostridiales bacterium]|nr:MAG: SAM-dependent methyltransferase [Clostridiales bacterium GWD2_32_19]HCC08263.1 SAM-dependent methyltransferase [Clostridiales bacterium]